MAPDTEIVLLTAFASTDSAVQALRLRIHDYLIKPAAPAQVIASVKKGLARRAAKLQAKSGTVESTEIDETAVEYKLKDGTVVDLSRRQIHAGKKVEHLSPMPGTPFILSDGSPRRPFQSGISAGRKPNRATTAFSS